MNKLWLLALSLSGREDTIEEAGYLISLADRGLIKEPVNLAVIGGFSTAKLVPPFNRKDLVAPMKKLENILGSDAYQAFALEETDNCDEAELDKEVTEFCQRYSGKSIVVNLTD
jgi:hypothetical protein